MKKVDTEIKIFFAALVFTFCMCTYQYGSWWFNEELPIRKKEAQKNKKDYGSLEILKYNADTIEFVFHDNNVKREFNAEWQVRNGGSSIQEMPVSKNLRVLKYSGDTIQIKFENARIQRQFEQQWRKYNGHKLNSAYVNTRNK